MVASASSTSLASLAKNVVAGSPRPQAPALSRVALNEIFSNFPHILHLNTELLTLLEQRLCAPRDADAPASVSAQAEVTWDPAADELGDILVSIAPYFKMYSLYVKDFSAALSRIETERKHNDSFSRFLKQTEAHTSAAQQQQQEKLQQAAGGNSQTPQRGIAGVGLGFQAHLLSIVQRIPRYKMLVDNLVKSTPSAHKDYQALVTAAAVIEQGEGRARDRVEVAKSH